MCIRHGAGWVLAASALVFAVGSTQAQELKNINFMSVNDGSCSFFPQFMIQAFGFLEKQGYGVTLLESDTSVPYEALLSNGDADIVMLDPIEALSAVADRQPIKIVYEAASPFSSRIVVTDDSEIYDLSQLDSKTVGFAGQSYETTLQMALDSVGIEADEVTTVAVGNQVQVMAAALRDNKIDAFAGGSSHRAAIEAQGIRLRNITPDAVSKNPGYSLAVWGPTIEEKRPLIAAFLHAWAQAQHAGVINRDVVAAACARYVPAQFENVHLGVSMVSNSLLALQLRRAENYGEIQPDIWKAFQSALRKTGNIESEVDLSVFLDNSFEEAFRDVNPAEVTAAVAAWDQTNLSTRINSSFWPDGKVIGGQSCSSLPNPNAACAQGQKCCDGVCKQSC